MSRIISRCNSTVAKNVKRIIDEKGLKQVGVARKANIDEQSLSDMLNGRRIIKASDIEALIEALEIEPAELFVS